MTSSYNVVDVNELNTEDFSFRLYKTNDFVEVSNNNVVNVDFFIFPAFINFDFKNSKVLTLVKTNFFILILGKLSNDVLFSNFTKLIMLEFLKFGSFLIILNIGLWFVLMSFIFFAFGVIFYPLKKITQDYQSLYCIKVNNIYLIS